jgi:hypothetical protein
VAWLIRWLVASGDQRAYRYPDDGDAVAVGIIAASGLSGQEWEQQESFVLQQFDKTISAAEAHRMLDYGSGLGRIAKRYASLFESVTSYEPDADRLRDQQDQIEPDPNRDRIDLISALNDSHIGYDLAVCSHIIQHVSTELIDDLMDDLVSRVRRGGHFILLTTLSAEDQQQFAIGRLHAGRSIEVSVSRDEFNAATRDGGHQLLPVHFFPFATVISLCGVRGLEVVEAYGLHGRVGVVGPVATMTSQLDSCRDIAVLARRR